MSRSDAVRQAVLERDGYRCQVCGYDGRDETMRGRLNVHHVDPLGMGGSDELDTEANALTVCLDCHAQIHSSNLRIVRWGEGVLECVDIEQRKIPHERLWFHRRKAAAALEPVEARLSMLHRYDAGVARDAWTLASGDAWRVLDPESRTFREYAASRGWDAGKAVRLARLWGRGLEMGVEWEPGMSEADFSRRLRDEGKAEKHAYFYLRIHSGAMGNGVVTYYRTHREADLRDAMSADDVLVKIGKCVYGLRAENGRLVRGSGEDVRCEDAPAPSSCVQDGV